MYNLLINIERILVMIKAGFARVDVTPPLGSPLAGYFKERFADGVLDPIELNALAFSNGESTAIIIASDFIGMHMDNGKEVRELIEARTSVPADHIMICCLHQHTSLRIGGKGYSELKDTVYLDLLYRKYADVAKMALDDMSEATVNTAERQAIEEIAFVRRYWLADGTLATNPKPHLAKPVRRCDESDNTVRLIRFKREGKNDIAYVNFSTHPDTISGTKFSADWPGFVRRFVEAGIENTSCLCVVGCQGDSNHVDFMKPIEERLPEGPFYPHSRRMGRIIAETVKLMWNDTKLHTGDTVFGGYSVVYNKTNTDGEDKYDEQKRFLDNYNAGIYDKDAPPSIADLAFATRITSLRDEPIYHRVPVTVLGLGDIAFVGFGGEPFTHYTIAAKEAAGDKTVFCSCVTNGNQGYLPHERAFTEGGYEASGSFFTPTLESECIAAAKDLLDKF